MKKKLLFLGFSVLALTSFAQQSVEVKKEQPQLYKYRLYLHDKKGSSYKIDKPIDFLSQEAIQRRKRLGIAIDHYDLPVSPKYLATIRKKGVEIQNTSKWNNTVVVCSSDENQLIDLKNLNFVDSIKRVYAGKAYAGHNPKDTEKRLAIDIVENKPKEDFYGNAAGQNKMLGVDKLHQMGYHGEGVKIAVIDGGFYNADRIPGLQKVDILGTKNFVHPDKSVYDEPDHGMNVLACLAGNTPNVLIGTSPKASYYLLVSEDGDSEFMVEEDNWCAAVEYADSLGVDLITTSLGYVGYDDSPLLANYQELDGKTHLNSRSASLAHTRGLIIVNSGGNSGTKAWKNIGWPADATNILAVGAVKADSLNANFSSIGWTVDGRVKPDVTAQGQAVASFDNNGKVFFINGTSFSGPITAGAVALLRQAYPKASAKSIMDAVRKSGHKANIPDNIYGYGIPNMVKAFELLKP